MKKTPAKAKGARPAKPKKKPARAAKAAAAEKTSLKAPIKLRVRIGALGVVSMPYYYLSIPKAAVAEMGGKFNQRLVCSVGSKLSFHCALMSMGDGSGCITLSREKMSVLKARERDWVTVTIKPDKSRYGMSVPKEFQAWLKQDKEGAARFNQLSGGKQRSILFQISGVKNPKLRLERSAQIIEGLKKIPVGQETMRDIYALSQVKVVHPSAAEIAPAPLEADDDFLSRFRPIDEA